LFDRTVAAYRALQQLLADGRVRAIGVSNLMPHHLADLLDRLEVVPAVNQVELHPYFTQPAVQQANSERCILTQAWSPIGGITFYTGWGDHHASVLADPTLAQIAATREETPAQGTSARRQRDCGTLRGKRPRPLEPRVLPEVAADAAARDGRLRRLADCAGGAGAVALTS